MTSIEKPDVDGPVGEAPSYQLELEDITVGEGDEAAAGRIVEVHYVGVSWATGEQFDASWDRGDTFKFGLGKGQVIPGWDQGVAGMKVGGRRRITIPPMLGLRQARRRRRDRARRDARLRRRPDRRQLTPSTRCIAVRQRAPDSSRVWIPMTWLRPAASAPSSKAI